MAVFVGRASRGVLSLAVGLDALEKIENVTRPSHATLQNALLWPSVGSVFAKDWSMA